MNKQMDNYNDKYVNFDCDLDVNDRKDYQLQLVSFLSEGKKK